MPETDIKGIVATVAFSCRSYGLYYLTSAGICKTTTYQKTTPLRGIATELDNSDKMVQICS